MTSEDEYRSTSNWVVEVSKQLKRTSPKCFSLQLPELHKIKKSGMRGHKRQLGSTIPSRNGGERSGFSDWSQEASSSR